jgi:hypothetical protein
MLDFAKMMTGGKGISPSFIANAISEALLNLVLKASRDAGIPRAYYEAMDADGIDHDTATQLWSRVMMHAITREVLAQNG